MAKMQGIILDVYDKWAVILDTDGNYKKVKVKGAVQVGEQWNGYYRPGWKSAVAAIITLALLGGCLDFFSVVAYAEVASGVKIGINRWDRVVSVEALGPETSKYVKSADLTGQKAEQAVAQVVKETVSIKSDQAMTKRPLVNVTSTRADESNCQRLTRKMDGQIQQVIKLNSVVNNKPGAQNTLKKPGQSKQPHNSSVISPGRPDTKPITRPEEGKFVQPNAWPLNTNPAGKVKEKNQPGVKKDKSTPAVNNGRQNPAEKKSELSGGPGKSAGAGKGQQKAKPGKQLQNPGNEKGAKQK